MLRVKLTLQREDGGEVKRGKLGPGGSRAPGSSSTRRDISPNASVTHKGRVRTLKVNQYK